VAVVPERMSPRPPHLLGAPFACTTYTTSPEAAASTVVPVVLVVEVVLAVPVLDAAMMSTDPCTGNKVTYSCGHRTVYVTKVERKNDQNRI
jgi:hypothetical protein